MHHERQQLQRCLLHTLNNLLQRQAWSVQALNEVCDSIHATRTRWLGNYDANVLTAALELHGLEVKWHDARDTELANLRLLLAPAPNNSTAAAGQPQQPELQTGPTCQHSKQQEAGLSPALEEQPQQDQLELKQQQPEQQQLFGLILNVAGKGLLARAVGGRHWLAIRWLQGAWWNLDSHLPQPLSFAQGPDTTAAAAAAAAAAQAAGGGGGTATAAAAAAAQDPKGAPAGAAAGGDGGAAALIRFLQQQLQAGGHLLLVYGGPSGASTCPNPAAEAGSNTACVQAADAPSLG